MMDSIAIFPFLIIPKASVNKVVVAAYRATFTTMVNFSYG